MRRKTDLNGILAELFSLAARGGTQSDILNLIGGYFRCILLLSDERRLIQNLYIPPEKETDYDSLGWRHILSCLAPSLERLTILSLMAKEEKEKKEREKAWEQQGEGAEEKKIHITQKEILIPLYLQGRNIGTLLFKHPKNHFSEKDQEEIVSLRDPLTVAIALTDTLSLSSQEKPLFDRLLEGDPAAQEEVLLKEGGEDFPPELLQGRKKTLYLLPLPESTQGLQDILLRRLRFIFSQTGFAARCQDALVLVTEGEEPWVSEAQTTLLNVLILLGSWAVHGGFFTDWRSLPSRVRSICPLLPTLQGHPGQIESLAWGEFQIMKQALQEVHLGSFHPGLPLLQEYDEKNNTELCQTVKTFLRQGCRASQTARVMIVHRNTLLYRLQKAQEIGGFDLGDPDDAFLLRLSFELEEPLLS